MFYRAAAIFIVLFWVTMTGLLIRNVEGPGDAALREVPFSHVVKLLFLHEQPSELNIMSDKLRLGHLHIQPRTDLAAASRTIEFAGNLQLLVPGGRRHRFAWKGELEMEKDLSLRRFRMEATVHEPADMTSEITVIPAQHRARYELRGVTGVIEHQDYSLDENGARAVFQQLGLDPSLIQAVGLQQTAMPELKAQQSSLETHGESIDTYLVTIERGGQTFLDFHVDQLGHVLQVKTIFGYDLVPDDITP